jgi:hypothetical protein
MKRSAIALFIAISATLLAACSDREQSSHTAAPIVIQQRSTTLYDLDQKRSVLQIDGWQDYNPGDVVSVQDGKGSGRDFEIVRGWFVVTHQANNHLAVPDTTRMYHVRSR